MVISNTLRLYYNIVCYTSILIDMLILIGNINIINIRNCISGNGYLYAYIHV